MELSSIAREERRYTLLLSLDLYIAEIKRANDKLRFSCAKEGQRSQCHQSGLIETLQAEIGVLLETSLGPLKYMSKSMASAQDWLHMCVNHAVTYGPALRRVLHFS